MDPEARKRTLEKYRNSTKYKLTQERYLETEKGQTYLTQKRARHRDKRRKTEQSGTLTAHEWRVVCHAFRNCCAYCGVKMTPDQITIDHIKPLSKGGEHIRENVVPACYSCNDRKGTQDDWTPNPPIGKMKF